MTKRYDQPFRAGLPADLADFVRSEARAAQIPEAAVLRQAVIALRAAKLRHAEIEAAMLANEEVC
jgi:hypothetical protein